MNYSSFIVKIIENPIRYSFKDDIYVTEAFIKFSQVRTQKILKTFKILIWGNLGDDVIKYYQKNDYIIIEGYLSIQYNLSKKSITSQNDQVQISIRKIYPFP